MIKSIDEYLLRLKKELSGCHHAVVEEALSNSEEHLREALSSARETNPGIPEQDLLSQIIEKYGMPEEIAATYKESKAIDDALMSGKGISTGLIVFLSTLFTAAYFLGQGIVLLWWNDMNADGFEGLQGGYIFFTWALLCLMTGILLWWFAGYIWFYYYKRKKDPSLIVGLCPVFLFLAQGIALLCYWLTQPEGWIRRESGAALIISILSLVLAFILLLLWVWVVTKRHVSSAKVSSASPEIWRMEKSLTPSIYIFLLFPLVTASTALFLYWAAWEVEWERTGKGIALLISILLLVLPLIPLLTWIVAKKYQSSRKGLQLSPKKSKRFVILVSLLITIIIFGGTFFYLGFLFNYPGSALFKSSSPPSMVESIKQLPSVDDASDLSWSPDGRTILYESSSAIWTIDSDGGNQIYLGDGWYPAWSPDGSKIAFVTENGLEVMNADGSERKVLVNETEMVASTPSLHVYLGSLTWSPDGGMIAFQLDAHESDEWGQTLTEIRDIWLINADGSNLRQLTTDPAYDSNPVWSPNSQMIAFTSNRSDSLDIWVIHFDGTGLQQLTTNTGTDYDPSWSPDGSRIAFASSERKASPSSEGEEDGPDIWVMDADGGNKLEIVTGLEKYDNPVWSPDGSKIAYDSTRLGPFGDIWIVELDGYEKTKLTDTSTSWFTCEQKWIQFQEPKWSPDGMKLLFRNGLRIGNSGWGYDKAWVLEFKPENS